MGVELKPGTKKDPNFRVMASSKSLKSRQRNRQKGRIRVDFFAQMLIRHFWGVLVFWGLDHKELGVYSCKDIKNILPGHSFNPS